MKEWHIEIRVNDAVILNGPLCFFQQTEILKGGNSEDFQLFESGLPASGGVKIRLYKAEVPICDDEPDWPEWLEG